MISNVFKSFILIAVLLIAAKGFPADEKKPDEVIELNEFNSYILRSAIDFNSVDKAIQEITKRHITLPKGEPIYLSIDSPGGNILAGMQLINHLRSLDRPIHTITFFSASMAFVTVQALGKRYIVDGGILMAHYGSTNCGGNLHEIQTCLKRLEDIEEEIDTLCSERIGVSMEVWDKMIERDLWLLPNEAIRLNIADKRVKVKCSESLMKSSEELIIETFFGQQKIEVSGCPTMLSPLESSKKKNGK